MYLIQFLIIFKFINYEAFNMFRTNCLGRKLIKIIKFKMHEYMFL